MIISRTPLRISLGGGGTDLPSYYKQHGNGFLVAAAINKHIYVSVHENFSENFLLKYSQIENVDEVTKIRHPLIREALIFTGVKSGIEISSLADIPAGTGLGSSGAFAVGMLKAIYGYQRKYVPNYEIAANACILEIEKLAEPIGKQDQYIAALGGLTALEFHSDGTVSADSVRIEDLHLQDLQEHLLLFYTGVQRSASSELSAMNEGMSEKTLGVRENLDDVKKAGIRAYDLLEKGHLDIYAIQLTHQWELKLSRSPSEFHQQINTWIQAGLESGALGGKLVGAGGGGFLLFFAEEKSRLRKKMREIGLREVKFSFDFQGSVLL